MRTAGQIIMDFLKSGAKRDFVPYDGKVRMSEQLRKAAKRAGEALKFANEKGKGVHILKKG